MAEYKVISNDDPHSTISEQYRKLRTNIDFSSIDKKIKVINFTSAFPGEGKTLTCLNLATVYSQTKKKTLLIDMDLRRPKIHRAYKVANKNGINECVLETCNIDDNIVKIDDFLDVLVAGEKVPFPSELLDSTKIRELISELKKKYDMIIIDSPPMTAAADASIISNFCDGTIFTIASRHTNRDTAKGIIKDLEQNGANVLGAVLTRVQKRDTFHSMDYYYYYGDS